MLKSIEPGTTTPHHGQHASAHHAVPTQSERYPTAQEVMGDIAKTIAGALIVSLAANLLLLTLGL
jgi:cell division septation protein DedD